jgi:hypothetical protein
MYGRSADFPHDLKKSRNNDWYAQATKGGQTLDVVLPPGGQPFAAHDSQPAGQLLSGTCSP